MIRPFATILTIALMAGAGGGWAAEWPARSARLQPESVVSILIAEDGREALLQKVAFTGQINAPYVGLMKAAGLTCDELADRIKQKLEKDFFKQATVIVERIDSSRVRNEIDCVLRTDWVVILEKAKWLGKYQLPDDENLTVSGLLKKAGGSTSAAPVPTIKIIRRTPHGHKTILVNAHAILVGKSKEHDLYLREKDVVIVE